MAVERIDSLAGYLEQLRGNKQEVEALYQDLLITVTEFFRDPDTFEMLENTIIPQILNGLPDGMAARVWVPGCASGEEAYSIAICFAETARDRATPVVRIFATDVSKPCIAKARQGFYAESRTAGVSAERLYRFFVKESGGYRVNKVIRDLCVFAKQEITRR